MDRDSHLLAEAFDNIRQRSADNPTRGGRDTSTLGSKNLDGQLEIQVPNKRIAEVLRRQIISSYSNVADCTYQQARDSVYYTLTVSTSRGAGGPPDPNVGSFLEGAVTALKAAGLYNG